MSSRRSVRAVLAACLLGGGLVPLLTPAEAALPDGYPKEGCWTQTDVGTDGGTFAQNATQDKDMELLGMAVNTTATDLKAYLKVDTLAMPKSGVGGHQFQITFQVAHASGAKTVDLVVGEPDAVQTATAAASTTAWNAAKIDGQVQSAVTVTPTFDKTNSWVIISAPIDKIAAALATNPPAPFAPGIKITALSATSTWIVGPSRQPLQHDSIADSDLKKREYVLGESPCFTPPPGILANVGATSVQFTDAAKVAAKLTDKAGTALAGKTVTFSIGSKTATATTDSDGVATTSINPGVSAGKYSLVAKFAGDSSASEVTLTTPFTVASEKTKLALRVVKSGTRRTVYATLTDDDRRPVAGQTITWYINGKKVSSPKTNASGVATLTTAKPTQTVKAVYGGASGKYLGTSAQAKV